MRYKVVYKNSNGELESCCRNTEIVDTEHMVIYPVNQWTEPKIAGSKLFCFKTFDAADRFINNVFCIDNLERMEIWECEVEGESEPTKLRSCWSKCSLKDFWELFNNDLYKFNELDEARPPKSTVMVSRLKLIKRVDNV